MQFVIFRLFGYIPAPILFGNLIDSSCLLWKSTCGEKGGRCLLYDIEKFRYKYVGLCAVVKIIASFIFAVDWWLVRKHRNLDKESPISMIGATGSIISLDKCEYLIFRNLIIIIEMCISQYLKKMHMFMRACN